MKIVIIISTNGGVLSQLLNVPYFSEQVAEVISDRECGAIDIARQAGIRTAVLLSATGDEFSEKILNHVDTSTTDLFISFYTKLLNKKFVSAAKNKIINLHPSILPACPGKDGFGDTVKSGSTFIGSTIHFVDEGMDTGMPIIQSAIPFNRTTSVEEMRHAIFVDQCRTLLQTVKWVDDKRLTIGEHGVTIESAKYDAGIYSPKLDFATAIAFDVPYAAKTRAAAPATHAVDPASIVDLRGTTNHPVSLQYSEIYSNGVLTGTMEHGRSQPGCGLTSNTPFVLGAKKAAAFGIDADGALEVIESVFAAYYDLVQPASAVQWLGVTVDDGSALATAPPWASVFPWRARSVASYQQAYEKATLSENGVSGAKLDITNGWLFCGPVSAEKRRVEAMRMLYVLKEISCNGYKRSNGPDGDVKATALVNETGDWRWLITAGNHRAAAASALGYTEIPIRVNLVICRQHAKFWPHIVDGLYSEREALKVFDNFFDAVTPPIMNEWCAHVA